MNQIQQDIVKLLEIQEKERELLSLEGEKDRLPRSLAATREEIALAEKELAEARGEVKSLQVRKKDLELDSESKLEAVAKYQKQQFEVKSNTDYQALQKEITDRQFENSRIEDQLLEAMLKIDEAEKRARDCESNIARMRERLAAEEKSVAEAAAGLDAKIAVLKTERDALFPALSAPLLRKFQRIFANKRDSAVVPLVGYTCGGCHMRLPPQIANNVRKDELVICESCSRILYWPEGLEKKAEPEQALASGTGKE